MPSPRFLLASLLIGSLSTGGDQGAPVSDRARRNWIIILVTVGVVLDLAISGVLGLYYHRTNVLASQNHQLKVGAYEACLGGNEFRTADAKRWNQVLALVDTQPNNPATHRFVVGVQNANRVADQPSTCQKP
jgi:hypothetical protein